MGKPLTEEQKARRRAYYIANREKLLAAEKMRQAKKREEISEKAKARYQRDKEANQERARSYYRANREARNEYDRQRYGSRRQQQNEYARKWYEANKEKIAFKAKLYRESPEGAAKILERNSRPDVKRRRSATNRRRLLSIKYGLTTDDYDKMLANQGSVCAICRNPETGVDRRTGKLWPLAVDHDHATGKVRGLLCRRCNQVIGTMEDRVDLMHAAIAYLDAKPF